MFPIPGMVWSREGMSIVGLGGVQDGALQGLEPCIVLGDERQSDCEGLLPRRRMQALGPPGAGGCGGDVRADLGPVVLALGMVHVRAKRSALAPQRRTTPHEVTGGAHLSRIDVCLWQPTPAQPSGHLVGIDRVVCGFPAVDGLPGEGMPPHTGHALLRTEVGQPVPGEETRDGHAEAGPIRGPGCEQRFGSRLPGAVEPDGALLTQDADIHGAGLHVDATGKWVLLGVESP